MRVRLRYYERIVIERYRYCRRFGCPSWCALEILALADGRTAVVATEPKNKPGTSITNVVEYLAECVCKDFGIDPKRLVWIVRCGDSSASPPGTPRPFYLVTFDLWPWGRFKMFAHPRWRRMRAGDWIGIDFAPNERPEDNQGA